MEGRGGRGVAGDGTAWTRELRMGVDERIGRMTRLWALGAAGRICGRALGSSRRHLLRPGEESARIKTYGLRHSVDWR